MLQLKNQSVSEIINYIFELKLFYIEQGLVWYSQSIEKSIRTRVTYLCHIITLLVSGTSKQNRIQFRIINVHLHLSNCVTDFEVQNLDTQMLLV